jgi:hypothetical protein
VRSEKIPLTYNILGQLYYGVLLENIGLVKVWGGTVPLIEGRATCYRSIGKAPSVALQESRNRTTYVQGNVQRDDIEELFYISNNPLNLNLVQDLYYA